MPLRILPRSSFDAATLSMIYGAAVAGYPAANVLTSRRSEFARINGGDAGGGLFLTRFELVLPADTSANCAVFCQTSLRSTGYVNAYVYNAAATQLASVTGQNPLGGDGPLDTMRDTTARGINNLAAWFGSTPTTVRKVAFEIVSTDSQNDVGRLMAGVYKELGWNFNWQYNLKWLDPSTSANTYGGDNVVTYAGPGRRQIDLPFEGLAETDIRYLFDLVRVVGLSGELFISCWPNYTVSPTLENRCQMWCRIKEVRGFQNPTTGYFGTGIVFEEL